MSTSPHRRNGAAQGQSLGCRRWHPLLAALGLAALAWLVFLPALANDFVNWDDDVYVVDNDAVQAADGWRHIWSTLELPEHFPNYPVVFTSFWLEYRFWGLNPSGYHATNVVLHGVNAALVFWLALALGGTPWIASLTAVLFAVHPMQVESVAWITERKNVLSAFFGLAAFLAYLRHRTTNLWRWYLVSLGAFVCALLSKTALLVLPLSMLLADYFRAGRWSVGSVRRLAPLFVLGLAAGLLTVTVESRPASVPLLARPSLAAACLWFYAGKLVVPLGLSPVYPRWDVSLTQIRWWLPLIGVLVAAGLVYRWGRDPRQRWGLAHFACMLLPALGLRPYGFNEYSFVADRHVYLASVGLFLVLAIALDRLRAVAGRQVQLLACLVGASLIGLTWKQIPLWRDPVTLWSKVLVGNPGALVARNNLGMALIDRGRLDEAAYELQAELALKPDDANVHNNLALVFYRKGDFRAAEYHCRQALVVEPGAAGFHKNLGLALQSQGQLAAAEAELRRALELQLDPGYHYLLASLLIAEGRSSEAAAQLDAALQLRPDFTDARDMLVKLRGQQPWVRESLAR